MSENIQSPLQGSFPAPRVQGFALVFDETLHPWLMSYRSFGAANTHSFIFRSGKHPFIWF